VTGGHEQQQRAARVREDLRVEEGVARLREEGGLRGYDQ
jgi:hypothetical protein